MVGPKPASKPAVFILPGREEERWDEVRFIPGQLIPVVSMLSNRKVTAYLQPAADGNHAKPSGRPVSRNAGGKLAVEIDGASVRQLPTADWGPVHAFDLDSDGSQRLAIAALHVKDGQTRLALLRSRDAGRQWEKPESFPLEGEAKKVRLKLTQDGACIAYSLIENDFSIVKMVVLPWKN